MTDLTALINRLVRQKQSAQKTLDDLLKQQEKAKRDFKTRLDAGVLAKTVLMNGVKERALFEKAVNSALDYTFQQDLEFSIEAVIDDEGNPKGLDLVVKDSNNTYSDIIDCLGSSISSVIDGVLCLCSIITNAFTGNLVLGDELFYPLSQSSWERFLEWLVLFCKENDVQLIMTTHHSSTAGTVYNVNKEEGRTTLARISN